MLGRRVEEEPGFAEMEFGAWDGLTFAEVAEQRTGRARRLAGLARRARRAAASRSGTVEERVLAALDRVLDAHAGQTVVVVSHVTPIKTLVAHALDAPLEAVFRMELAPASVTVLSFFTGASDGGEPQRYASLRHLNALAAGRRPVRRGRPLVSALRPR